MMLLSTCSSKRSALKSQELKLKGIKAEIDGAKNEIIALQVRRPIGWNRFNAFSVTIYNHHIIFLFFAVGHKMVTYTDVIK